MKPLFFREATQELKKPSNMTDAECGSLYVYQSYDGTCISLWTTSLWKRIKFLFHGRIWLGVHSGKTQPPVWIDCSKTVFVKEK